jgi:hypothetical protein
VNRMTPPNATSAMKRRSTTGNLDDQQEPHKLRDLQLCTKMSASSGF